MINLEQELLKLIGELKLSEFNNACNKAGISDSMKELIMELIEEGE